MKRKFRPPVAILFLLAYVSPGLCRRRVNRSEDDGHSSGKDVVTRGPHYAGPKVPGIPITHLSDLSVLDPYNIMSGKSFESKEAASLVPQIIPLSPEDIAAFSKGGSPKRREDRQSKSTFISNSTKEDGDDQTWQTLKRKNVSRNKHKSENVPDFHGLLDEEWPVVGGADSLETDALDHLGSSGFGLPKKSRPDQNHQEQSRGRRKYNKLFTKVEKDRNALLHEAVRKLLGFSATPRAMDEESRYLPDPTRERRLPRYVKDLYKRFQSGEIGAAGLAKGNTVRSIHTSVGTVKGRPMFLFNLSSLRPTEKLLSAEIHLYKRRLRRWANSPEVEVLLYQVAPHYLSETGKITILASAKSGWQWYDVTTAVNSCLAGRELRKPYTFGLSFQATSGGRTRPLPLKKFGRHHSMPFLVVHSNETEAVNFEQLDHLAGRLFFPPREKSRERGKVKVNKTKLSGEGQDLGDGSKSKLGRDGNKSDREGRGKHTKSRNGDRRENETDANESDSDEEREHTSKKKNLTLESSQPHGVFNSGTPHEAREDRDVGTSTQTLFSQRENPDTLIKPAVLHHFENNLRGVRRSRKHKRSVHTNEIPTDPSDYENYLRRQRKPHRPKYHREVMQAKKASNLSKKNKDQARLLPSPDVYFQYKKQQQQEENERRRRKNRRKKKKKKHRSQSLSTSGGRRLKSPSAWGDHREGEGRARYNSHRDETLRRKNKMAAKAGQGECGRKKLVVDFADIGWEDWIISPKSFEAHYCAGECPFPLTKRLRPSNHATIQSIVHAVGIYDQVPAPCCVPDQMSPVTLLYFDEDKNVVLKNYPGMTVDSCACR